MESHTMSAVAAATLTGETALKNNVSRMTQDARTEKKKVWLIEKELHVSTTYII